MHRLVLLALAAFAATPSAQLASRSTNAIQPDAPCRVSRTAGLQVVDGEIWGGGDGYKVHFTGDGFEFTPAFGRAAPRNYPLTFRLDAIGRGETSAPLASRAPVLRDRRLEYDRGTAIERYDVGVDGIEQSFVFAALPPGTGDLVVRGQLTTDLLVSADGDGLRFELPGVGYFTMGAVVGIDGNGVRARGSVRYRDGHVEYSLPAAFVERAALPLTLDPPIGSVIAIAPQSADDASPWAAYDASNDVYLVVWSRVVSASDSDVYAQFVRGGNLFGSLLQVDVTSVSEHEPQVTNCPMRDAFVVTYTRSGNILGRTVNALNGNVSPTAVIAAAAQRTFVEHSSSLSSSLNDPSVVCVWQTDGDQIGLQSTRITVDAALRLSAGTVLSFAVGAADRAAAPRLSMSDGGSRRHALVFQRELASGANSDPVMVLLDGSGAQITPEHRVDGSTFDDSSPTVDGDGTDWVVAWQRGADVLARSVSFDPTVPGMLLDNSPAAPIAAGPQDSETAPLVMAMRDSYLIGFRSVPPASLTIAAVLPVDPFLCTRCESVKRFPNLGGFSGPARGCTVASGGGNVEEALLTWDTGTTNNRDILAQGWRANDGVVSSLGGGCGTGGTNRATCAVSPNPSFAHRLRDSLPSAPAVFVLSAARLGAPCGSCSLVPDPRTGIVLSTATNTSGDQALTVAVPSSSPLVGVPLFTQWLTLDLASPACPVFAMEMSNALQIAIERMQ